MIRSDRAARIAEEKFIAIIRLDDSTWCQPVISAMVQGGLGCIEITSNTPNFTGEIAKARVSHPDTLIGAGTIHNETLAKEAADAGAQFLVTPNVSPEVIAVAHLHDIPVVMGAFTPTEAIEADRAGADLIKLFPADIFGPSYLKTLLGPFDHLKILPTGGVTADNWEEWRAAGAVGAGLGSSLFKPALLSQDYLAQITANATTFASLK